jgi:anti-anti-sigma regulatory factor
MHVTAALADYGREHTPAPRSEVTTLHLPDDIPERHLDAPITIALAATVRVSDRGWLKEKIEAHWRLGHRHLVLDCDRTAEIDAACTGFVIGAARQLRERGGTLVLARVSGKLRALYEVIQMQRVVDIAPEDGK